MWIILDRHEEQGPVLVGIRDALGISRFTAEVDRDHNPKLPRGKSCIRIHDVKLRHGKEYCGQHPGPCVNFFHGERHRTGRWLEGSDWVGFNNLINDVMDDLKVRCTVFSYNREALGYRYYIRKDGKRRVRYAMMGIERYGRMIYGWQESKNPYDFEDHIGQPHPTSQLPDGTPGCALWRRAEVCPLCLNSEPNYEVKDVKMCYDCAGRICHTCGKYPCNLHGPVQECWKCFRKPKEADRVGRMVQLVGQSRGH